MLFVTMLVLEWASVAGLAIISMVLMVAMVVYWFGIGPSGISSTNYMALQL